MKRLQLVAALLLLSVAVPLWAVAQRNAPSDLIQFLESQADDLNVTPADVQGIVVSDDYQTAHNKLRHLYINQTVNGVPVANATATIIQLENGTYQVTGNRLKKLSNGDQGPTTAGNTAEAAVSCAATRLGMPVPTALHLAETNGNQQVFVTGAGLSKEIPVQPVYWYGAEGQLRLSWSVSMEANHHWWHAIVDANDCTLHSKVDWVAHCNHAHVHPDASAPAALPMPVPAPVPASSTEQYNVFELPLESANHGSRTLVVCPADTVASPHGWHDNDNVPGAEFTITRGNNVHAYADSADADVPGYSPDGGSALDFDFTLFQNVPPPFFMDPAITNLFYVTNRMHDIAYHYGFDEAAGNFQDNNYGNGGMDSDYLLAESHDSEDEFDAVMATPPDGDNPRMELFLWPTEPIIDTFMTVNSPSFLAGIDSLAEAQFGPPLFSAPMTLDLAVPDDGTGPDVNDACETITNGADLLNKIAIINRGQCPFVDKVLAVQAEGAQAAIIVNNQPNGVFNMGGDDPAITIPSLMLSQEAGDSLINAVLNGDTVNVTLQLPADYAFPKVGDFDNGIIVHEYAHGMASRLTGGPANADCLDNDEAPTEGWADWFALMLTTDTGNANMTNRTIGTYLLNEDTDGDGLRPLPYDTSFAVNDVTYGDLADADNESEVGFVWASMLWDLGWAFVDTYGYDADVVEGTGGNNIAMQLIVDAMKLQPCNPGFVDARDAILAADQVNNGGANRCMIWEVFARRGLGFGALQGSPESSEDQLESFDVPPNCIVPTTAPSAQFEADTTWTCNGTVRFIDMSDDVPHEWMWDFGDGVTDTVQNPTHTYQAPGQYTVTLTVTNTLGNDVETKTQYIEFGGIGAPTTTGGSGCSNESVVLTAQADGNVLWFNSQGTQVFEGDIYPSPPVSTTTTYVTQTQYENVTGYVGPADNSIGGGGIHGGGFTGTVDFYAETSFIIHSAWVNSGEKGPRDVTLWDAAGGNGNAIQIETINFPVGAGRVDLGFEVPGPGFYSIGLNNAELYRNNEGADYPYVIPGVVTLTGSSAGTDFYYYFYDLEIGTEPCLGDTAHATVTVAQAIDFSYDDTSLEVQFTDDTDNATAWMWNFGDGNTSTDQNPLHTYANGGIYSVTLTTDQCEISKVVDLVGVGIDSANRIDMQLQPNPARDIATLSFSQPLTDGSRISIVSMDGKVVQTVPHANGIAQVQIPVNELAAGMYWIEVSGDVTAEPLKLVVLD